MYRSSTGKLERWFNPNWIDLNHIPTQHVDLPLLKQTFIDAVVKRLMSDAPLAILLSGGLDSSLVASVAVGARTATVVGAGGSGVALLLMHAMNCAHPSGCVAWAAAACQASLRAHAEHLLPAVARAPLLLFQPVSSNPTPCHPRQCPRT